MIELVYHGFLEAWVLGLIATLLGRYAGRSFVQPLQSWRIRSAIYLKVWGFTYLAALVFGALGYWLDLQEVNQITWAEFMLPIIAGAAFCRSLLLNNTPSVVRICRDLK